MEIRGLQCDMKACDNQILERAYGDGFAGWGSVQGLSAEGGSSLTLCPEHLAALACFLNTLEEEGK